MALLPIPVLGYLTPAAKPAAPADFITITSVIQTGLPHTIPLDQGTRLIVSIPTGLAMEWRDADPAELVTHGADELEPVLPGNGEIANPARVPGRLTLRSGNSAIATMPLALGARRLLPGSGAAGVRFELIVLDWAIHAGSIRGRGNFGSRVSVAWRVADRAIDQFSSAPPNPVLVKRLPPPDRIESRPGPIRAEILDRFVFRRNSSRTRVISL